jgi:hypothetical protein
MDNITQSALLIDALLKGKQLEKNCAKKDSDYYNEREQILTLWCEDYNGCKYFYMNGWGSALGTPNDRLIEIITNPDNWLINEPNVQVSDTTGDEQRTKS